MNIGLLSPLGKNTGRHAGNAGGGNYVNRKGVARCVPQGHGKWQDISTGSDVGVTGATTESKYDVARGCWPITHDDLSSCADDYSPDARDDLRNTSGGCEAGRSLHW